MDANTAAAAGNGILYYGGQALSVAVIAAIPWLKAALNDLHTIAVSLDKLSSKIAADEPPKK